MCREASAKCCSDAAANVALALAVALELLAAEWEVVGTHAHTTTAAITAATTHNALAMVTTDMVSVMRLQVLAVMLCAQHLLLFGCRCRRNVYTVT